ncbi:MAG TPA: hypothetical protein VLT35_07745 [Methanocella sp.]|nr:hypothetical protein [Methanocella sp.]
MDGDLVMSRRLLVLMALLLAAIALSGCCCCCGDRRYYSPGANPTSYPTDYLYNATTVPVMVPPGAPANVTAVP